MDQAPLRQFVGRATRDAKKITRRDTGEVVTDKHGNPMAGFGIATSDGYGDDATTTFFDVTTSNPGLVQAILDKENGVLRGKLVAIEGTVQDGGDYNDKIWAMQVAVTAWLPRSKAGETVQTTEAATEPDEF